MQNKKKLIGIISFVFAMVFVFMFMITINNVFIGHITFGDFYSRTTLSIVMLFLSSAIASFCFFNKIAKKVFHSNIPAALIGIFGLLAASVIDFYWGDIVINNIYNGDMAEIIKGAVVMLVSTLVGGFVTGFGITMFDFSKKISQEETVPTVEQANIGNTPISKTVSAILAFLFGGLGVHRYYLGYKKQGIIQTGGFVSWVIAYSYYITVFLYSRPMTLLVAIVILPLTLFGAATSIWAFVDFIYILTGKLQPANGNGYSENQPQQIPLVHPKETASETADAIAKLAKLHEQGVLTDEEFQKKKTELLAKI